MVAMRVCESESERAGGERDRNRDADGDDDDARATLLAQKPTPSRALCRPANTFPFLSLEPVVASFSSHTQMTGPAASS